MVNEMSPFFEEDWPVVGSVLYSHFNGRLWEWKSQGKLDSILVNPFPHFSHRHIADILGYDDVVHMTEHWTDESTYTLQLLCGPNGFTIYKMLVIKWEDKVNKCES